MVDPTFEFFLFFLCTWKNESKITESSSSTPYLFNFRLSVDESSAMIIGVLCQFSCNFLFPYETRSHSYLEANTKHNKNVFESRTTQYHYSNARRLDA